MMNSTKRILFTLLFWITVSHASAQTARMFQGTINNKMKITLYLQGLNDGVHSDPIVGSYRYDNMKDYILLNGYINNKGNLNLVELATPNFSGTFLGTLAGNKMTGTWISADQKKHLAFELTEIVPDVRQINAFKTAVQQKAEEFRNY